MRGKNTNKRKYDIFGNPVLEGIAIDYGVVTYAVYIYILNSFDFSDTITFTDTYMKVMSIRLLTNKKKLDAIVDAFFRRGLLVEAEDEK